MGAIFDNNLMTQIIDIEGGYVKDPDDPGGETKYGISKATYPDVDIKNLTIAQAYDIYNRDFWGRYNLSVIYNQPIANKLLFALINLNPKDAITAIQKAVNACDIRLNVDGALGIETLRAINLCGRSQLLEYARLEYVRLYYSRVVENRKREKYLLGWIKRALL